MFNKSTLTITTSALVLMSTGVAGAASNPFSDVPQVENMEHILEQNILLLD